MPSKLPADYVRAKTPHWFDPIALLLGAVVFSVPLLCLADQTWAILLCVGLGSCHVPYEYALLGWLGF